MLNTCNMVSNHITALVVETAPGYDTTSTSNDAATSSMASVAESICGGNTGIPQFEWVNGNCVACGNSTHRYMKPRSNEITYFNVNFPGAKENMVRNVAKVQDEMSKKQRDKVIKAQVE